MNQPLADKLRPRSLEEVVGQEHLLQNGGAIQAAIEASKPLSVVLWGPPGCGKTSIARLYAKALSMDFKTMNAVFSGVADLKKIVKEITDSPLFNRRTVLFVDEIHRFNKAQQDAFLPYIEDGTITLVGATAENPSFYLNNALLSRVRVLPLNPLDSESLGKILLRFEKENGAIPLTAEARTHLFQLSQGDGRYLLNLVESLFPVKEGEEIDIEKLKNRAYKKSALSDKSGEQHYNLISALHKSVRGSDPDASLYWFCRLLEGGEDPLFIARRLIRMATEDIGAADPQALPLAVAAKDSYQMLGSPEGELGLAEVVVYLALAPKSNALYTAYKNARSSASKTTHLPPPKHILNSPTKMMKDLDYGKGYVYDHETEEGFSGQNYFPDSMPRESYYSPVERGFEREMKKRLEYFSGRRSGSPPSSTKLPKKVQ